MNDKKLNEFQLKIKPKSMAIELGEKEISVGSVEELEEPNAHTLIFPRFLDFDCEPDILSHKFVLFFDETVAIEEFLWIIEILEDYAFEVQAFDHTILDDMKTTISNLLNTIYDSIMLEHTITLRATQSSDYVLRQLMNAFVNYEEISQLLEKLSGEICDRLSIVWKHLFLKS